MRAIESVVRNFFVALEALPCSDLPVLAKIVPRHAVRREFSFTLAAPVHLRADSVARAKWQETIEVLTDVELIQQGAATTTAMRAIEIPLSGLQFPGPSR